MFVYMSLSVLAFCPAIATPPLSNYLFHYKQWCTADAEVKVPCAENPALLKMHSFKSDSATMEVGIFQLVPGALPYYYYYYYYYYYFILFFLFFYCGLIDLLTLTF